MKGATTLQELVACGKLEIEEEGGGGLGGGGN